MLQDDMMIMSMNSDEQRLSLRLVRNQCIFENTVFKSQDAFASLEKVKTAFSLLNQASLENEI